MTWSRISRSGVPPGANDSGERTAVRYQRTDPRCAKLKAAAQEKLETMTTKDHLARHDSQIARLEQAMTALAEAQVKTEEAQAKTDREMAKLARAMTTLAESQVTLSRQWQAYLNTLGKN